MISKIIFKKELEEEFVHMYILYLGGGGGVMVLPKFFSTPGLKFY